MDSNRVLVRLTLAGLRTIFGFVRRIIPPLVKAFLSVTAVLYRTLIAFARSLKPEVDRIARNIQDDLCNYVPIDHHNLLRGFSVTVAYLTTILEFVLIAHITVWLWHWLWSFV